MLDLLSCRWLFLSVRWLWQTSRLISVSHSSYNMEVLSLGNWTWWSNDRVCAVSDNTAFVGVCHVGVQNILDNMWYESAEVIACILSLCLYFSILCLALFNWSRCTSIGSTSWTDLRWYNSHLLNCSVLVHVFAWPLDERRPLSKKRSVKTWLLVSLAFWLKLLFWKSTLTPRVWN